MSVGCFWTPHGTDLSLVPVLIYIGAGCRCLVPRLPPVPMHAAIDLVLLAWTVGVVSSASGDHGGIDTGRVLVASGLATPLAVSVPVGYTLGLVGGMLCLVTLRWRTPRGDILACSCLLLSLASASQGVGFAAGAALLLVTTDGWRYRNWIRRAWVVAIPVAFTWRGTWIMAARLVSPSCRSGARRSGTR